MYSSNNVKQMLKNGETVLGASMFSAETNIATQIYDCKPDWVWIDLEHTPWSFDSIMPITILAHKKNVCPIIRVGWNDPSLIKKAFDIGAGGVMIPQIDSAEEAEAARLKAEKAGAPTLLKEEFSSADQELTDLAKAVEDNKLEKVREDRVVLAKTYRQLELKAMKQDIIESAQTAIKDATDMGAKKYAPKTFSQAEEEMRLALNILEVNRGASQEAENYAERARWWAERSMAVTETVKSFKQGDYTDEDIVLWYQEQISSAVAPVNKSLPLNYDHKRLMTSIRTDLEGVVSDNSQLASQNKMLSAESQTLANAGRQQAIEMQNKLNMTRQQAQEADKKFEFVQGLFDEKEAVVFRQQNAVLLRTQGFDFPSGKSEITSGNFALLQKIIKAIDEYPTAKVAVSGHTDSVGDAQFNQKLSEDRAQKVAEFLTKVGNIDEDRISYKGYGEARPIASNDTQDGRSENRRVEITIVN